MLVLGGGKGGSVKAGASGEEFCTGKTPLCYFGCAGNFDGQLVEGLGTAPQHGVASCKCSGTLLFARGDRLRRSKA